MTDLDAIRERDHGWHFSGEDRFSAHDYMQAGLDRRHLLARVAELEAAMAEAKGRLRQCEEARKRRIRLARPEPKP